MTIPFASQAVTYMYNDMLQTDTSDQITVNRAQPTGILSAARKNARTSEHMVTFLAFIIKRTTK